MRGLILNYKNTLLAVNNGSLRCDGFLRKAIGINGKYNAQRFNLYCKNTEIVFVDFTDNRCFKAARIPLLLLTLLLKTH